MADALTVSVATEADHADWLRLWGEWQRHMSGAVPEQVTAKAWEMITTPGSGLMCLMARMDGVALGIANISTTPFAWTAGPVVFLQDLYVAEAARGKGVGSALLKGVYGLADDLGAAQVFWLVDETDTELQAFYARHGIRTPYLRYMRRGWEW